MYKQLAETPTFQDDPTTFPKRYNSVAYLPVQSMPPHMAPTAGSDNTSYISTAHGAYMFG